MVRAAIHALRRAHSSLAADVADGLRFFWLGSGISRNEVPDLTKLLERVLLFLRDQSAGGMERKIHQAALEEILATHLETELSRYRADLANWTPLDVELLRNSYSEVLSTRVGNHAGDYLLMTAADLPNTYASPDLEPGINHRLIAILIAEGVLKEMASGNWDGLIETAVAEITGQSGLVNVYVTVDDARRRGGRAQIAKFHGCAALARDDPDHYKDKIIATRAQIGRFSTNEFEHMRNSLKERTSNLRSLILGLSLQDDDLLSVFTTAADNNPWEWDSDHPAYIFAQPEISGPQRDVLENGYRAEFNSRQAEIVKGSAFGTYAEPLLAGLVLEVLIHKYSALLRRQCVVDRSVEDDLAVGIQRISNLLVATFCNDPRGLFDFLVGPYTLLLRNYLRPGTESKYIALFLGTRSEIRTNDHIAVIGSELFASAIGLLGWGEKKHLWRLQLAPSPSADMLQLVGTSSLPVVLAVVRGAREADAVLSSKAWTSDAERMAILYVHDRPMPSARSSASHLGGGRRINDRYEVTWSNLVDGVANTTEIAMRFQTGLSL